MVKYKIISLIACVVSSTYTFFYMSLGKISLTDNSGALSTIGLDHPVLFAIWGVLTLVAICSNFLIMYKHFKPRYNFNKYILPVIILGMIITITCKFDFDIKPQYFAHCIGSLCFTALTGINLLLFFINFYKKSSIFKIFTFLVVGILITTLVLLLIFKESSVLEVAPMMLAYIIMCLVNCTKLFEIKEDTLAQIS